MAIYARLTHNQRPTYHPIVIYQGATFKLSVALKNTDGTPFDLTDYSVRAHLRRDVDSTSYVSFSCLITDLDDGLFDIKMSAKDTKSLECINSSPTSYVYDVEIYDDGSSGNGNQIVYRILSGKAEIIPEVTR